MGQVATPEPVAAVMAKWVMSPKPRTVLDPAAGLGGLLTACRQFDGRVQFSPRREWRELNLKFSTHTATVEIHSLAASQTVSVQITNSDMNASLIFTFSDLQNPNTLLRKLGEGGGSGFWSGLDLPVLPPGATALAQNIPWEARRIRLTMGRETVSAYQLETRVLGQPIVIHVSTLGEILRVELPGGVTAVLDEWSKT